MLSLVWVLSKQSVLYKPGLSRDQGCYRMRKGLTYALRASGSGYTHNEGLLPLYIGIKQASSQNLKSEMCWSENF
jgi:hypothetical protein